MGRKRGKKPRKENTGSPPRRGMRRSIRFDAVQEIPDPRKLSRGPEAPPCIHLRKISAEEALGRLEAQLKAYARQGIETVLVVHGKGQNSAGGVSVLRPLVRQWCDEHPALVSSWREAPPNWGGAGAIVVVLN